MPGCEEHVQLFVEGGGGGTQAVPVRRLPSEELESLFSPGFVEGIAAGDVVKIIDAEAGTFEVRRRGGNLSVKLLREAGIGPVLESLEPELALLRARVDGNIERAAVLTIPISSGFRSIEAVMSRLSAEFPGLEWYFGNVYDPAGKPLNWWTTQQA
jgi:hypothetical protein